MICFIIKVFSSTNAFLLEINLQDLLTRNIAEILLKLALKTNKSINLFLIPPSLNTDETEDKQTNFTVNLGSGVVLPCKVEGDPLPTIVWYKDESPISMTDLHYFIRQDGSLEIFRNISRGDYSPCTNNDTVFSTLPAILEAVHLYSPVSV
jgi:hypothetical protein